LQAIDTQGQAHTLASQTVAISDPAPVFPSGLDLNAGT
jgi:hypothetical protein